MKTILHVDLDAFFASVEELDNPEYRGKPVIVGADPQGGKGRGVVSAASYAARKFGVHSAMPISRAFRLCPQGVFVTPRGRRYSELSHRVFEIFRDYTDLVEGLSIDEAFLDVTGSALLFGSGTQIARKIKDRIKDEVGLVASVGVAPNKFVAKIASDLKKPDALVVVEPGEVESFLAPLPISRLWGVGEKTAEKLKIRGIRTFGDVANLDEGTATRIFGSGASRMRELARGIDDREVIPDYEAKSIGNEETFKEDVGDVEEIKRTLLYLADKVAGRLRKEGCQAKAVTLKFRDEHFNTVTRQTTLDYPTAITGDLYAVALSLLDRTGWSGKVKVRLVGISASKMVHGNEPSGDLFSLGQKARQCAVEKTVDKIRDKFGKKVLTRGALVEKKN